MKIQVLFASLFLFFCVLNTQGQTCNPADFAALHYLYDSTNGSSWFHNTGWNVVASSPSPPGGVCNIDLSTLHGIYTDVNGRVTEIILNDNGLTGSLPSQIGDLAELRVLNLHDTSFVVDNNSIGGTLPTTITNLTKLVHQVANN